MRLLDPDGEMPHLQVEKSGRFYRRNPAVMGGEIPQAARLGACMIIKNATLTSQFRRRFRRPADSAWGISAIINSCRK